MTDRAAEIAAVIESTPIYGSLSIELAELSAGEAHVSVRVDERHCNIDGVLHGGIAALLADTAMGCAARSVQPAGTVNRTVELAASFFRPGRSGDVVTARARVRSHAGRLAWAEATLSATGRDGDVREIGTASSLNYEAHTGS